MPKNDCDNNPHSWNDYSERARGLLLALYELQSENDSKFCKCSRVIRRFFDNAGLATETADAALSDEQTRDADIEAAYQILIGLYHDQSEFRMIEGKGNFGTPNRGFPPARHLYTEIGLTSRGRNLVRSNQL